MALFDALDALDMIRLSGTDTDGWYIENARAAMERGDILFAGKYSEPDYELLLTEGCDVAIESTMISHSPKVQELLELLGIPVFVDRSSYEKHPLGRTEWIKLYGVLADKEEQASAFFADYLIYNATIDEPLDTIDELLARSSLLADFKAVREGNVWCTDKYLYQATDVIAGLITDIHNMLIGEEEMTFLHRLS